MTRPEPVATADLVAWLRDEAKSLREAFGDIAGEPLDTAAKALEDTAAERDRLAARLADIDDGRHIVELDENGWCVKHPLECRDSLLDCPVNAACREWDEQPAPPGRYVAVLADDGSLTLRGEPVSERTPTDVLVEQARAEASVYRTLSPITPNPKQDAAMADLLTALAKALEDTAAERDRWRAWWFDAGHRGYPPPEDLLRENP